MINVLIVELLCFWLAFLQVASQPQIFELPHVVSTTCLFQPLDCITSAIEEAKVAKTLLIVVPWCTPGNSDIYIGLYTGWTRYMFSSPHRRYTLQYLMIQTTPEDYGDMVTHTLHLLPTEAFWVTFGLPDDPYSIADIGLAKANGSLANFSLIHSNPAFESFEDQAHAYQHHSLVVRNDFKSFRLDPQTRVEIGDSIDSDADHDTVGNIPGRTTVLAVPLGASYYGHYFGQTETMTGKLAAFYATTPSHQRTIFCAFAGRRTYGVQNEFTATREELFHLIDTKNEENTKLAENMRPENSPNIHPFPCTIEEYDLDMEFDERYRQNVEQLVNTVFVPCPPGIKPETFRHYEALEAGCIPLIVASKNAEYLDSEWWRDYPGPIFTDWKTVGLFLHQITTEDTYQLQETIRRWYVDMKLRVRVHIEDRVCQTYSSVCVDANTVTVTDMDEVTVLLAA